VQLPTTHPKAAPNPKDMARDNYKQKDRQAGTQPGRQIPKQAQTDTNRLADM